MSNKRNSGKHASGNMIFVALIIGAIVTAFNCKYLVSASLSQLANSVVSNAPTPVVNVEVEVRPQVTADTCYELTSPENLQDMLDVNNLMYIEDTYTIGHTTAQVNVRSGPSTDDDIVCTLPINTLVEYADFNTGWYRIKIDASVNYICNSYVSAGQVEYTSYQLQSSGFKSYMPYTAITLKSSKQYKLQSQYAYTGQYGIRQVDGRFCIALGSAVNAPIGTYVDLILENNTIIPCVLSDQKADRDTRADNLTTDANGCVSEFLIDSAVFGGKARSMGDVSYVDDSWRSPVVEIRVYDENVLNR